MRILLDVNLLIALLDPEHVHHEVASKWFSEHGARPWASCPLTENGFTRIVSLPSYPYPALVSEAVATLAALKSETDHAFWPDSISICDPSHFDHRKITTSRQVTDAYLLALAKANGGILATMDRKLANAAGREAADHICFVD